MTVVILRTQITSLKTALGSAKKKLSEIENSRSDSPVLPDIPFVTPLKVSLIEETGGNGRTSPLDYERKSRHMVKFHFRLLIAELHSPNKRFTSSVKRSPVFKRKL